MFVTMASYKGGCAKSTSAIHLAAYFQELGPTLLIDGDLNRSAIAWSRRGTLPFRVVDEKQGARFSRDFEHVIIDTAARPERNELEDLAGGCDLLVIPTTPEAMCLDALMLTTEALHELGTDRFRVLLTIVPPRPSRDGDEARDLIVERGLPIFSGKIRRLSAFQKASLQGVVVRDTNDPRAADAWSDYFTCGEEIVNGVQVQRSDSGSQADRPRARSGGVAAKPDTAGLFPFAQ